MLLMTAFSTQGLKPRIAFTARDADVIKTYVRSGFGVGILAGLAVEPGTDDDLAVIEIPELFPRLTTWIGYPKDLLLKKYHCEFIRLLAPHLTVNVIEAICSGSDAAPPGGWPAELEIPLRTGGK